MGLDTCRPPEDLFGGISILKKADRLKADLLVCSLMVLDVVYGHFC